MSTHPDFRSRLITLPWRTIGSVLLAFLVTRLVVFGVTYLSMIELPLHSGADYWRIAPSNIIVDGLVRWDSGFYRDIVLQGYPAMSDPRGPAFFPLYPMLVWALYKVVGHVYISGLVVSNLMFLAALGYLYALVRQEFNEDTAGRAVFYLAAAPAAFFFSAFYSESTFLACLIASFYYARNGRWWLAGLAGAAASAARIPGILAAVFILFEALWRQGIRFIPKPLTWKSLAGLYQENFCLLGGAWRGMLAALIATGGLAAYMAYLDRLYGNPLEFLNEQFKWGRGLNANWAIQLYHNTFPSLYAGGSLLAGKINAGLLEDVFSALVFLPLVVIVVVRMRPSYGLFALLAFLMPLASANFLSMRRLVLALVPCYILLAAWGRRPWLDRIIVGVSLPLQAYLTVLFTHWYFAG